MVVATQVGDRIVEEQAALRRVATLVARAAAPEQVFASVTEEVGRLLSVDYTLLSRYDPDRAATAVGAWSRMGGAVPAPVGTRIPLGGGIHTLVLEAGRPARIDDYGAASGPCSGVDRRFGIRAMVGVPIKVDGRLWGAMVIATGDTQPLPAGTEDRLAGFTELVATAIANAQARVELRGYADEQAALRRVATLVARAVPPEEVFAEVTASVGRVLCADIALLSRYDPDGAGTIIGMWSSTGALPLAVGRRVPLGGRSLHTLVFQTGRPARIDDYTTATGPAADLGRAIGMRSAVGVPISVDGRPWGIVNVASTGEEPPPADTEARLAGFTELVATALANAEAQAALAASRARIVAAADTARRRIERDLHDGVQQRLVSLALQLRGMAPPPGSEELKAQLGEVAAELTETIDEVRELARGIHPSVLAKGGLRVALATLARRSVVAVELDVRVERRLPAQAEIAAYYVVSEALTNAAKHAHASAVQVEVFTGEAERGAVLRVRVRDDGDGGVDLSRGSGLLGLKDRVEALDGSMSIESPAGNGTELDVMLPITAT